MTTETTNEVPGVLDRIANIWSKKKEDAKTVYGRLLRRAELDQKQLSDRELIELTEAMKAAGISLEIAQEHRSLCEKVLANRPVAAQLEDAKKAATAAQAEWERLGKEIAELQRQQQAAFETSQNNVDRSRRAQTAADTLAGCAEQLARIGIVIE